MSAAANLSVGILGGLLSRVWWVVLLRGLAAILFGVLAFAWPGLSLIALIYVYAAYAVVDGVLALAAAIRGGSVMPRWWLALAGVVGILAGAVAFLLPGMTAILLAVIIGAWAVVHGVLEVIGAIALRKSISNEWMLGLAGAISILFGALLMLSPGAGALALLWLIAAYAVIFGVFLVVLSLLLRRLQGS